MFCMRFEKNQKDGRTSDCHSLLLVDTFQRFDRTKARVCDLLVLLLAVRLAVAHRRQLTMRSYNPGDETARRK